MENNPKVFSSDKFALEQVAGLSLFIYPDFLMVFAKDKNQTILCIHHYSVKDWNGLGPLLASDSLTKQDVPVRAFLHQKEFLLIPGVVFQQGKELAYFHELSDLPKNPYFFSTGVDSNNIQLVSFISQKLHAQLAEKFTELSIYHGASSFLSYLFKERFNLIGQEIWVNLFGKHLYLAGFTDQELVVFNQFEVESKEEVLKYILIGLHTLQHDRNHARITFIGSSESLGISESWAKEYLGHVRLLDPAANQNFAAGFVKKNLPPIFEAYWQYL
ncbi:MAG: DUF3822 family protein [Bacteroidota bacterium]|nr:DUF3822 family protein [Algoriphagus sp.]